MWGLMCVNGVALERALDQVARSRLRLARIALLSAGKTDLPIRCVSVPLFGQDPRRPAELTAAWTNPHIFDAPISRSR